VKGQAKRNSVPVKGTPNHESPAGKPQAVQTDSFFRGAVPTDNFRHAGTPPVAETRQSSEFSTPTPRSAEFMEFSHALERRKMNEDARKKETGNSSGE
jgi:hypothetical protein